ncbi:phenylalanine--tRNA ligase beta subunit-related protein [Engelhardtia mirabilis]|uniref:B3/4 domain protein n=1 Tax=Engelhardtia mirabilis TaxID=2528011 RepID=A0A518BF42_9BACT|nr:B3/4 domain protein [Planctomycetes bacterium Pla133]QDU99934.1 B3/4 domain protein [Planctomycetes bacterium Pla86]
MIHVDAHPLLEAAAFRAQFPSPLGDVAPPDALAALLSLEASAPLERSEEVRAAVRRLLRHGGYRPTGRGKPASEYLVRAVGEGALGSINLAVDACNVASLHSGLPISVVDVARTVAPLRIGVADADAEYVFNTGGQAIALGGLLCLFDAEGPCANAVKDSQRTKTSADTTDVIAVVWGTNEFPGRAQATAAWYRALLESGGARTESVELS